MSPSFTSLPQIPGLRQDLRLHASGPAQDGSPTWVIQDPVSNRFFRIGWLEYECLLRWPGNPEHIARDIEATTPLAVEASQIREFGLFLDQHRLTLSTEATRQRLLKTSREPGWKHWRWWLHHYLFIRIPLIRPQIFLEKLAHFLTPLFSPIAAALLLATCLSGLLLVARQWEQFTHAVFDSITPAGILGFALALFISKTLHELGHALVATRMGVRVAHMGVAFLVMWPMLYTDTGESWRLRSHRQRLAISVAGITAEIALAGLAALAWALLDDGILRQAALYLATTGWVLSLALNLSPFMRFDGYFILSDLIDFPNLHERSGLLARVWLRRILLGLDQLWPEALPKHTRHALIAFALTTWIYRLLVFLGIALLVYYFFFKALGVFLMLVELVWFIARPLWSEIVVWKIHWPEVHTHRRRSLLASLAGFVLLALIPWRFDVSAHGLARAEHQQQVYAPFPAELASLRPGGAVAAGELLAAFTAPDLLARQGHVIASTEALDRRLTGLLDTSDGINKQLAVTQRLDEQQTELRALKDETGRLIVRAEFSGEWRDVSPVLRPGNWLSVQEPLGILIDPSSWVVDAYIEQRLVERIVSGAPARFLPQGALHSLSGTVVDIDTTRTRHLPHAMLESQHGGHFNTTQEGQETTPSETLYRVRIRLDSPPAEQHEMRGSVHIDGTPRSLVWEAIKGSLAILIRESGF